MLEGITAFDKAAGFIVKHAGKIIYSIGCSVRLLPAECVDTFYYWETNYGYLFPLLRQKVWAEVVNIEENREQQIAEKYQELKKEKCITYIKAPTQKERAYYGNKTFLEIEQPSNLLTNKSLSVFLKISGLFFVIYGVPNCALALSIILSYKGVTWLTIGVASLIFGHDLVVTGHILRENIDPEEKNLQNKLIIPVISYRSWFFFRSCPEKIDFQPLKEELDKKTYLVSVIVDNMAKIWSIPRTETIFSKMVEKMPSCCQRKKMESLPQKN